MTWWLWLVCAFLVLNALVYVAKVGEPCEPITGGDAVLEIVATGCLVFLIIYLARR